MFRTSTKNKASMWIIAGAFLHLLLPSSCFADAHPSSPGPATRPSVRLFIPSPNWDRGVDRYYFPLVLDCTVPKDSDTDGATLIFDTGHDSQDGRFERNLQTYAHGHDGIYVSCHATKADGGSLVFFEPGGITPPPTSLKLSAGDNLQLFSVESASVPQSCTLTVTATLWLKGQPAASCQQTVLCTVHSFWDNKPAENTKSATSNKTD